MGRETIIFGSLTLPMILVVFVATALMVFFQYFQLKHCNFSMPFEAFRRGGISSAPKIMSLLPDLRSCRQIHFSQAAIGFHCEIAAPIWKVVHLYQSLMLIWLCYTMTGDW